MHGTNTSFPELTHVSRHGLWLLLNDEELFLSFETFPWFRRAAIEQLSFVESPTDDHLYWPQLDVDVAVQSIRDAAACPLESKEAGPAEASRNVQHGILGPQVAR